MSFRTALTVSGAIKAVFFFVTPPIAGLLLVAILTSRKLRQSLRHVSIASLTAADFLFGLLYCSVAGVQELRGGVFDCSFAISIYLFEATDLVSCWGLVLQHVYYLLAVADVKPRKLSAPVASALRLAACLLPWVLSVVIVLVLQYGVAMGTMRTSDGCERMTFNGESFLTYLAIVVYVPLSLAAALSIASIVAYVFGKRRPTSASSALLAPSPSPVESPAALNLATAITVVFLGVPSSVAYYSMTAGEELETVHLAVIYLNILPVAKSALVPLAWMADAAVRKRMLATIRCRCSHDSADVADVGENAMTYKSLESKDDARMVEGDRNVD